jgi:hypothetical protein
MILGDISKDLDANMNVSTLALKICACVDQVQFCTMGNKRHHTLASYGSNGRLGCKGFNVSMMGFEENECILGQGHWTHFN